jgi:hypothetical protein
MAKPGIYFQSIQWLEQHLLTCWFKKIFHFDCPGCGFQRSVLQLLKGDISGSFHLYPATIPILFIFVFTGIHLVIKFKQGAAILKYSYIFAAAVVLVSYIVKLKSQHLL